MVVKADALRRLSISEPAEKKNIVVVGFKEANVARRLIDRWHETA
jgi:hypothetical protein